VKDVKALFLVIGSKENVVVQLEPKVFKELPENLALKINFDKKH
jgi:hypothetical protein